MTAFDPWPDARLHLDWGLDAARLAVERGDAVVIVDALSFSTTVIMRTITPPSGRVTTPGCWRTIPRTGDFRAP